MTTNKPALPEPAAWQVLAYGVTQRIVVREDVADECARQLCADGAPDVEVRSLYNRAAIDTAVAEARAVSVVTDNMVSRFLCWPLPRDFYPDCGISFDGRKDDEWNKNKTWPTGTNLLTAIQARQMLEHVLGVAHGDME